MDFRIDNKLLVWWKLIPNFCVVLFCSIHWCCSFRCNEALEDVDTSEAGGKKNPKGQIRLRPWEFLQETSVCFGCQMSFSPFAVEEWIRIVDSFQIFHPKNFGIILCMFENRFFLVPTCKSEQMHYHWKRFFRRAATSMTFVMFEPLRAKVGYIFSTDQSTNPGPFNTEIQKLSMFINTEPKI